MIKKLSLVFTCLCLPLWATQTSACLAHMMYSDPEFARMYAERTGSAGFYVPPAPVFKLMHPPTVVATVGEESEVVINYKRPEASSNVTVELVGTRNVEIIDKELQLSETDGSFSARFMLTDSSGYSAITFTVTGEHEGETVSKSSRLYLRGKQAASSKDAQLSSR